MTMTRGVLPLLALCGAFFLTLLPGPARAAEAITAPALLERAARLARGIVVVPPPLHGELRGRDMRNSS